LTDWLQAFAGRTVVIVASGPSLTEDDCTTVRSSGLPVFVTNTMFRRFPDADVLVAHDARWWKLYRSEVEKTFRGRRFRCDAVGIASERNPQTFLRYRSFGNSGTAAIALAALAGARNVVLLGCDCRRTGGQTHSHGDHPPELSNARSIERWAPKFAKAAAYARGKGCEVVNASRETALTCFPRVPLEDGLRS